MAMNRSLLRYAVKTGEYVQPSGVDIMKKGASKLVLEVQERIRAKERRYKAYDKRTVINKSTRSN